MNINANININMNISANMNSSINKNVNSTSYHSSKVINIIYLIRYVNEHLNRPEKKLLFLTFLLTISYLS